MGRPRKTGTKQRSGTSGPSGRSNGSRTIRRIQAALSIDLLHPTYRPLEEDEESWYWACLGHCYVAAEAAYHLFGKKAGFEPWMIKHPNGTTHWWLRHRTRGTVVDPTAPQLGGKRFDYEMGRRAAFLTTRPSKRAMELMRRVKRPY